MTLLMNVEVLHYMYDRGSLLFLKNIYLYTHVNDDIQMYTFLHIHYVTCISTIPLYIYNLILQKHLYRGGFERMF